MTITSDELADRALHQGVRVRSADIGHLHGLYDDDARCITLHVCLTDYQKRSTLAHEISHATWRDRPTRDRYEHERRERRADADAARTLIHPVDYARAEALVGSDPGALAVELDVSKWVILAWQREARHGRAWTQAQDADVERR